jgi:hypothetical protein
MTGTEHARLSPSAAHRWMQCPASIRLTAELEQQVGHDVVHSENLYALEGTQAHQVAEIEAALAFGLSTQAQHDQRLLVWRETTPAEKHAEMLRHADAYVGLLRGLAENHPHAQVLLEQKVDPGVDAVYGTLDAAIVSPGYLHVVDYKYGMGVPVFATRNPQLMLYCMGGVELFDAISSPETVCMTIHQPRLGHTSHYCLSTEELRQWRDQVVRPAARLALDFDNAYFAPSESACRFCPAAGECRARVEYQTRRDFGNPDALSPEEIGQILTEIPDLRRWADAVENRALHLAYNEGITIPGWKVIRSGGRRELTDQARVIEVLVGAGYPEQKVARKSPRTLGDLERLVGGRNRLQALLGPLLAKKPGKEALVPEDDGRPAINATLDAQSDFGDQVA